MLLFDNQRLIFVVLFWDSSGRSTCSWGCCRGWCCVVSKVSFSLSISYPIALSHHLQHSHLHILNTHLLAVPGWVVVGAGVTGVFIGVDPAFCDWGCRHSCWCCWFCSAIEALGLVFHTSTISWVIVFPKLMMSLVGLEKP